MKTRSKSHSSNGSSSGGTNLRYSVGNIPTPIGPAKQVVWLNEVSGIDYAPNQVGIKRYNNSTIWCAEDDKDAQQLVKDYKRVRELDKRAREMYSEHLREKRHG